MSLNWQELEISQAELEEMVNFDLLSIWAIDISRVFFLQQKIYWKSLFITEGCSLFLVFLLFFSLILIVFRNSNWLNSNINGFILVFLITVCLSIVSILLLNYHLWHRAKKLKVFAVLLEKIKQYNNLIDNLKLVAELEYINSGNNNIDNSNNKNHLLAETELKKVLSLTKNSLLKSIELEKLINRDRHLAKNPYQLLANLESGLINLNSLTENNSNDYQQLLAEAIEIGLSVHQEIRKNQTLRKPR